MGDFPWEQTEQAAMNSFTSSNIPGHQKRCWRNFKVQFTPGWQVSLEECPHWRT